MEKHLNSTTAPESKSYTIGGPYYELPQGWSQPSGWICPKCGAVMAPSMMWCINCINGNKVEVTTNVPDTNSTPHLPKTVVWNGTAPDVKLT